MEKPTYDLKRQALEQGQPPTSSPTLRGRANRLWFAGGSALPAVANPALSDEPSNHYDHVRERDPEVYDPILPLGTPHQFLVGVVPGVRPLHHPAQTGRQRSGHALLGYHAHQAPIFEELAGLLRVVGPIEVDAGMLSGNSIAAFPSAASRVGERSGES